VIERLALGKDTTAARERVERARNTIQVIETALEHLEATEAKLHRSHAQESLSGNLVER